MRPYFDLLATSSHCSAKINKVFGAKKILMRVRSRESLLSGPSKIDERVRRHSRATQPTIEEERRRGREAGEGK